MRSSAFILAALLAAPLLRADDKAPLTDNQKISYVIGRQVGESLHNQGLTADPQVLSAGLQEALEGKPSRLTPEETQQTFKALQEKALERQKALGAKNLADGKAFLKANGKKKGVKTTKSGLQYKMETPGKGDSPKATDRVRVHYRGTLIDGTEFDSSYKRNQPAEFSLNGVIKGWTEGLQLMKPGAKCVFTVPAELAYGESGRPGIPPNAVLVFEVELLEVLK